MKVRDLIGMQIDIDCYDDVCEELAICFCGPLKLTKAGEKKFAEVMEYEITFNASGIGGIPNVTVHVDDEDDAVWKRRLKKANEFFEAAAGYCACDDYDNWFEED